MARRVQLAQAALQRLEVVEVPESDLVVEAPAQERVQHALGDRLRAREFRDLLRRMLAERVIRQVDDRSAHHREAGGQQALLGEVVERRQQLAPAEVAGRAEDDHDARLADAVIVKPLSQGIRGGDGRHLWAASPFASVTTAWPPNWLRIIASMLSPNVFSLRLRKLANNDSASIGTGTDFFMADAPV